MILSPRVRIATLFQDLSARIDALQTERSALRTGRDLVKRAMADGSAHYGINTGFGILAQKKVPTDQLRQLQRNLLLSHAVGVGPLIPREISRLMLQLKLHALAFGYSGVSESTFDRLHRFVKLNLIPAVPQQGSVGASGDLAPLAHLCLPLIGHGQFWDETGTHTIAAREVLLEHQLEPIELEAKDGLALINGTQFMSAYGAYILHRAIALAKSADTIAAMSLEALQGSIKPFDARLHEVRPHPGQQQVAANFRALLEKSEILESHRDCGKVQDPYSLRCVPQVHGASRDALNYARSVVETEINSVTDNPLVFENGEVISGGNFHGQPVAFVLDFAAMALAELASISERRTYLLLEGHDGLPALLMRDTGINSGFMIPQYTAAALVSENKVLCHPASVDSIPTCVGQEDHVSMGSISATKLFQVFQNAENVLAIELLTAAQALDYRKPVRPGRGVEAAHNYVRSIIPHRENDHEYGVDLALVRQFIQTGDLVANVEKNSGELQ